ncbi:hypothetical protein C368_05694 [Cryptococcus neoformans 125.91]|nr:hypothetical protein C368_05694 [Cryptococcus neoformans var. grubii 125.91]
MHSLLFRPLLPLHPHSYVLSVDASIVTSRSSSTSFLLSPSDILPAISPPPLPATDDGISGHIRPLSMPAVNCTSIGPGVPAVPAVPGVGGMRMCGSWYCLILRMILGMGSFSMSVVDQMLVAGAAPRVDYSAFLFLCRSVGGDKVFVLQRTQNLRTALKIYDMETILKPSLAMSSLVESGITAYVTSRYASVNNSRLRLGLGQPVVLDVKAMDFKGRLPADPGILDGFFWDDECILSPPRPVCCGVSMNA